MNDECPWCERWINDLWELFLPDYPDAVLTECEHCGKQIRVTREVMYDVNRVKETDDEIR